MEVCSKCHSFYTGQQKAAAARGRIDKFNKKYGIAKANKYGKDKVEVAKSQPVFRYTVLSGTEMKYSNIGGQAVMEGVMMRNGEKYAVAVRTVDKEIVVKTDEYHSLVKNKKILALPIVRGVFSFVNYLRAGNENADVFR